MPEADPEAKLTVTKQDGVTVVEFENQKILDELTIQQIFEQLNELVDAEGIPMILLNFRKVEHLSSAALGALITLNKKVSQRQGRMVLANIHPQTYEVFKITRLNKIFEITGTTQEGLRAFQ
jgi:anti-sigma B factor antagonist